MGWRPCRLQSFTLTSQPLKAPSRRDGGRCISLSLLASSVAVLQENKPARTQFALVCRHQSFRKVCTALAFINIATLIARQYSFWMHAYVTLAGRALIWSSGMVIIFVCWFLHSIRNSFGLEAISVIEEVKEVGLLLNLFGISPSQRRAIELRDNFYVNVSKFF